MGSPRASASTWAKVWLSECEWVAELAKERAWESEKVQAWE